VGHHVDHVLREVPVMPLRVSGDASAVSAERVLRLPENPGARRRCVLDVPVNIVHVDALSLRDPAGLD
jgi:hypothetical protein